MVLITYDSGMTVMDGGMGHLLRQKGIEIKGAIGSTERFLGVAMANIDQPELVREAHEDFLKAGAQVIITNSYACIPRVIKGDDSEKVLEAIRAAGSIARSVADEYGAQVAGSMPPLNASYRVDKVGDNEELATCYTEIAKTIAPYADVLICETMSCAREAAVACQAASAMGKPVWVSWCLAEDGSGNLMSGETVEEAVAALKLEENPLVTACLFNCSLPECTSTALPRLRNAVPAGVKTGAYTNGLNSVRAPGGGNSEYRDMSPQDFAELGARWCDDGSTIIGGCCGIFPHHINALAELAKASPSCDRLLHPHPMQALAVHSKRKASAL
jgi:S-methylmethionine-dependent homocysteine/selenocysteine methylase